MVRVQSVRARTTLAATLVVAFVLVAVGAAVVVLLRANLVDSAQNRAELAAREVAAQLAAGTAPGSVDDPDGGIVGAIATAGRTYPLGGEGDDDDMVAPGFAGEPEGPSGGEDDGDDKNDDGYAGTVEPDASYADVDLDRRGAYRFAAVTVTMPGGEQYVVYAGSSLATERAAVADVVRYGLLALVPVLAVVAAVTWLVTRRALRPVAAIRAEMAAITAGDLSRRVPVPAARDEIAELARTTNATLAKLEASVGQQRRFIADASHELRSPIAVLRTRLEVGAEHPELLRPDQLVADVVRLQTLAADLLLLARLDAGEQAAPGAVDLTDLVREEVARRAGTDRLPVRLDVEEGVRVRGNRSPLERVLGNLLDNAQRHACSEVRVRLAVRADGTADMEVADDGPGVPAAERGRVFERFVRLDEGRGRDAGGAGLGLAIVRDVVRAYGGNVSIRESTSEGAVFRVSLPPPR